MNALLHWFTTPEWSQFVKTLLHSLWQGGLIAAALALTMRRVVNPHWRYRLSLLALVMITASGIITWAALNSPHHSLPAPSAQPVLIETTPAAGLSENPQTKLVVLANRSPAPPPSSWTAWLALLWIVGAGTMLGRAGIKLAGAEQLRRSCQPLENSQVTQLLAEARRAVRLARRIRVGVTDKLTSPAVVGVLVPTLILPLSLVSTLTPEQIRFILLHELAHIRRGDYFANLFQLFIEALLFFNPAVWWISHQVRREREACCDALAIELSGAPTDYARTLVQVAENILYPAPTAAVAFGNEREPSSLADRIQRLLVPGYRPSLRLTWRAMVAAFALGTALLVGSAEGTRMVVGQISNPSSSSREPTTPAGPVLPTESESSSEGEDAFSQEFELGKTAARLGPLIKAQPVEIRESPEMHRVKIRLESIRFDRVSCSNRPLSELFRELSELSQTLDNDGVGLRFLFRPFRFGSVPVTIDPPVTNVNVFEILAAIQGTPQLGIAGLDANGRVTLSPGASMVIEHYPVIQDQSLIPSESATDQQPLKAGLSRPAQINSPPIEISGLTERSRIEYDVATGKTVATNGAVVRFKDTVLRADSIQVDRQSGQLAASGNVQVERPGNTNATAQIEPNIYSNQPSVRFPMIFTNEKRRAILNKLNQIKLERVAFDAIPLSNVVLAVSAEAQRLDPEGREVKITINSNVNSPDDGRPVDVSASKVSISPPLTNVRLMDALDAILKCADKPLKLTIEEYGVAISLKGQEPTPLFMREFKVDPTVFAQRLAEEGYHFENPSRTTNTNPNAESIRSFLTNAGISLDPMLGKSVFYNDRRGILLVRATMEELDKVESLVQSLQSQSLPASGNTPVQNSSSILLVRTFKVDTMTFQRGMESVVSDPTVRTNTQETVRAFFKTLGVELSPPKSVFYNDRAGELFVRTTKEELDAIESALQVVNRPIPQVNVKVRFVEVERANRYGFDLFLGTIPLDQIPTSKATEAASPKAGPSRSSEGNLPSQITGILTDPQYRLVLRALKNQKGVDILAEQEVTTLSGRQAQIQTVELKTVVNGVDLPVLPLPGNASTNNATNSVYHTQVLPFGPVLDVIPTVSADGYTIHMTVIPTVTEFLGYDDPGSALPKHQAGSNGGVVLPLPRMRIRQLTTSAVVWDGQTLVLGIANDQLITKQASGGFLKVKNPDVEKKQLLVFITPTIVDPAGNRANPDAESLPTRSRPPK